MGVGLKGFGSGKKEEIWGGLERGGGILCVLFVFVVVLRSLIYGKRVLEAVFLCVYLCERICVFRMEHFLWWICMRL